MLPAACPWVVVTYFPDLCRAVDIYCERTTSALDAEPVNALTNVAFLVAAGCAWRLQSDRAVAGTKALIRTLTLVVALVGLGSFLFHTVATRWAEWGDVIPIMVFMLLYLWLVLTGFFNWSKSAKLIALTLLFATTFYLEWAVPSAFLMGGALYIPALFALIAVSVGLYRWEHAAGKAMIAATGIFILALTARTIDLPICTVFPLGTHFLWHILNALFLYVLLRLAILHASHGLQAG